MLRRWALPVLLALVPLLHTALVVAREEVDLLYGDDWENVAFLADPSLGALVLPHASHRIPLSRLALCGLLQAGDGDSTCLLVAVLGVAALASALLAWRAVRTTGTPWAAAAVTTLTLSLVQYESWIWGSTLAITLCLLGVVGTALLLERPTPGRLAAGLLCSMSAALSLAGGLVLGPVGLALVAAPPGAPEGDEERRARRRRAAVWCACWLPFGLAYLHGLPPGAPRPGLGLWLHFFLTWLGTPLALGFVPPSAPSSGLAVALGVAALAGVGLLLRAALVDLAWRAALRVWLALAGVGLGAGALIALGRATDLGLRRARDSRYTTFSALVWLALVVACLRIAAAPERRRRERGLAAAAVVVVLGLSGLGALQAPPLLAARRTYLTEVAWRLRERGTRDPALGPFCTDEAVAYVRSQGWSVFRADPELPTRR